MKPTEPIQDRKCLLCGKTFTPRKWATVCEKCGTSCKKKDGRP